MTRVGVLLARASDRPAAAADPSWLDDREEAVLAGLRMPKRRAEWLLGRWTAKHAVSAFLGGAPAPGEVAVLAAEDGAPEAWFGDRRAPCALSISHRDGRACCAVAGPSVALGCDLELVEPRSEAFVDDFFTEAEAQAVRAAGPHDQDLFANLTWSAKESVLKARRTGLRADTRSVVVEIAPEPSGGAWGRFDAVDDSNERWRGWWAHRDGFVLTVVARPAADRPEELGRTPV